MTADTLSLTDFLMARIAEDEAATYELPAYDCEPGCCAPAGWVGHHCLICGTVEYGGAVEAMSRSAQEHEEQTHGRSRVLAECKTKRYIVENSPPVTLFTGPSESWVCRALASVYADHEDYRAEWAL